MKTKIKATNINIDSSVSNYIEKKIGSLQKFISSFLPKEKELENPIEGRKERIEFFIDVGKMSGGIKKGLFFSKARVFIPGEKAVVAKTESGNLREAIDFLKDELYSQLAVIKKRKISIAERKTREVKKKTNLSEGARFYRKGRIREEGL